LSKRSTKGASAASSAPDADGTAVDIASEEKNHKCEVRPIITSRHLTLRREIDLPGSDGVCPLDFLFFFFSCAGGAGELSLLFPLPFPLPLPLDLPTSTASTFPQSSQEVSIPSIPLFHLKCIARSVTLAYLPSAIDGIGGTGTVGSAANGGAISGNDVDDCDALRIFGIAPW